MTLELVWIITATAVAIWVVVWDVKSASQASPKDEDPLAECSCSAM